MTEGISITPPEALQILRKELNQIDKKHGRRHDDATDDNQARKRAIEIGACSDCPNLKISKINQDGKNRVELGCHAGGSPIDLHRTTTTPLGKEAHCNQKSNPRKTG